MALPLPQAFTERMQRLLGEEFEAFLASYSSPRSGGLRINPNKLAPEEFAARAPFSLTPIPWAKEGFAYGAEDRPGRHPWHDAGVYYMQEPSAMAVGALADPQPGERVLDLCAAPGGKTTHLAGRMAGNGVLIANEIHPTRAGILAQSVERMGISNCAVLNETPDRLAEHFAGYFDCVVVDAPCSGEGMFRKEDIAVTEWKPESPLLCAERQAGILDSAAAMVRPGGRLIYSTCTFAPEEDEGSVSRFLERHPDFAITAADAPWFAAGHPEWIAHGHPDTVRTFRLWPHRLQGEGHYAAVLHRSGGEEGAVPEMTQTIKTPEEWTAFCRDTLTQMPEGILRRQRDTLWLLPEGFPELTGLRVRRAGIELGTVKKNRIEPAHALSHALPAEQFLRLVNFSADSAEIERYLRGETFPTEQPKGWCAVAADGFVLGWGKSAGGVSKNHYPKGLRRKG
jgi:16S rRNA C967 or C1407 C5-methylase (RsmB/RsmF family)/NOL1/NOP2/fmu family ribosome biogenesis protein